MTLLYRGGKISPFLHPIDAEAWKAQGWTETPQPEVNHHAEKQPQKLRVGGEVSPEAPQEAEVAIALESPALALINSDKPLRDITIIDTLGKVAAEIILSRRPEGGYESLAQVWELSPEVLTGRMKVDPDVVAAWGSVPA